MITISKVTTGQLLVAVYASYTGMAYSIARFRCDSCWAWSLQKIINSNAM